MSLVDPVGPEYLELLASFRWENTQYMDGCTTPLTLSMDILKHVLDL